MSQSEKSFTVSDRRQFTADGQPREGERADEAVASQASAKGAAADASRDAPTDAWRSAALDVEERPADFGRFLLGLGAEAARLIAGEGLPEGAPAAEGLRAAREILGILEMLKDKTEGRRTADEDALVAELLFQLRMAYVERTRASQP
jgi:hypothetical protein